MTKADAYLNWGRWVVNCPAPGCTDARAVYPEDSNGVPSPQQVLEQVCKRGHAFQIVMPPAQVEAQIVAAVSGRPNDADRSWFPNGHEWGTVAGYPTGQTPADLIAENAEVEHYRTQEQTSKQDHIKAVLAGLGIEVRPDGTFTGSI